MNKLLIAVVVCGMTSPLWAACDKGYTEWEGVCAANIQPETALPVQPSDEKPPRSGLPAWQDPSVKALTPPSLVAQDEKQDQEVTNANSEGKQRAGIK